MRAPLAALVVVALATRGMAVVREPLALEEAVAAPESPMAVVRAALAALLLVTAAASVVSLAGAAVTCSQLTRTVPPEGNAAEALDVVEAVPTRETAVVSAAEAELVELTADASCACATKTSADRIAPLGVSQPSAPPRRRSDESTFGYFRATAVYPCAILPKPRTVPVVVVMQGIIIMRQASS